MTKPKGYRKGIDKEFGAIDGKPGSIGGGSYDIDPTNDVIDGGTSI